MLSCPVYFLTWTAYGTWLHGDERFSVDDAHNARGDAFVPPSSARLGAERRRLKHDPISFSEMARDVIAGALRDHCKHRRWSLLAINVRTNHVHVVVQCTDHAPPERAMDQFKSWATRKLREKGLFSSDMSIWTRHGSTRWIKDEESLARALDYVLNGQ